MQHSCFFLLFQSYFHFNFVSVCTALGKLQNSKSKLPIDPTQKKGIGSEKPEDFKICQIKL